MTSGTIQPSSNFSFLNGGAASGAITAQLTGTTGGVGTYAVTSQSVTSQSLTASNLAGCNMRADLLRLRNVSFNGSGATHSSGMICINWHNFAQSLDTDHVICENPYIGMNIFCDTTQGNNGEACPAFGRHYDFEAENCWYRCVNSSDAQDNEFFGGYALGFGAGGDIQVAVYNSNYGAHASSGVIGSYAQGFRWHGGRFGNASGSIMLIGQADSIVDGGQFFASSLGSPGSGIPNIVVQATNGFTPVNVSVHDNILCEASGQQQASGLTQGGIWIQTGVDYVTMHDNIGQLCAGSTVVSNYSAGTHIKINNNVPN
jgi:hypothetical protein